MLALAFRHHFCSAQKRFFSTASHIPSYKIAIVGSGPAAFYTAHHLLNRSSPEHDFRLNIDFFERLPAPYGLSRYGVAPDHPEVKNCEEYLDDIMQKFQNHDKHNVRFFGNVDVGNDVSLQDLDKSYHSVVLAYGCTTADNSLNIPGENLPGVISARQFVNWYNGFPDKYFGGFVAPPLHKINDVTIIGNGNVALDVARVLLADPETHWTPTDMLQNAVEILKQSAVKNVNIVARRGILESAFSNKEIRELFEVAKANNVKFITLAPELMDGIDPKSLGRVDKRRLDILNKFSKQEVVGDRTWSLKYLMSPKEIVPSETDPELLSGVGFAQNKLEKDSLTHKTSIKESGEPPVFLKTDLLLLSIGYKGSPLRGFEDIGIFFDKKQNRILNRRGRVLSTASSSEETHQPVYKKGWYTSGWIKNGPQGVIATTMMDSFDTADTILEDLSNHVYSSSSPLSIDEKLEKLDYVNWNSWIKLNQKEVDEGKLLGKSRVKYSKVKEMLAIAHQHTLEQ